MNVRKLSVNKACIFLAVLLLAAMVTVSVALYIVFLIRFFPEQQKYLLTLMQ